MSCAENKRFPSCSRSKPCRWRWALPTGCTSWNAVRWCTKAAPTSFARTGIYKSGISGFRDRGSSSSWPRLPDGAGVPPEDGLVCPLAQEVGTAPVAVPGEAAVRMADELAGGIVEIAEDVAAPWRDVVDDLVPVAIAGDIGGGGGRGGGLG